MKHLGAQLRIVRKNLGKTLSEVSATSTQLAADRGAPRYKISVSWLNRIENDAAREIGAYPLMALLEIYSITLEGLLDVNPGRSIGGFPAPAPLQPIRAWSPLMTGISDRKK
jgi:transcriptional regulator with XRE-family HTH domain